MTTSTYYFNSKGELEEQSCSEEETISSVTNIEELKFLSGKSKKDVVRMYLNGEVSYDVMQRWCQ